MPTKKAKGRTTPSAVSKLNLLGSVLPLPVAARGPEHKYLIVQGENTTLAHNTPFIAGSTNLLQIAAGTAYNQRIGNVVNLKKISVRLWLSNKSDRSNVMYRVAVVAQPYLQVDLDTIAELYAPGTNPNRILSRYTPYGVRVVYDEIINRNAFANTALPSGTNKERSYYTEFDINCNQTITYNAVGNADWQYGLYITAYDAYGTLTSDNIASFAHDIAVLYSDE